MRALLRNLFLSGLIVAGCCRLSAFSLLGPYAIDDTGTAWQVPLIGYQVGGDGGGPMNLGEEYRYNTPYLTYGYDESFLNYYGTNGITEIDKCMAIFNALPKFSAMSQTLSEFPQDTRRFNYVARALLVRDLKSWVMGNMMEQLGAAAPERWVWALRNYVPPDVGPIFTVIKRNFDPVTFEPSSYVNGTLYTYQIVAYAPDPLFDAMEYETDPTLPSVTSVAAHGGDNLSMINAGGSVLQGAAGQYFTGLTRDDVAALRYIYRPSNFNVENVSTDTTAGLPGSGGGVVGGGPSNPFLPPSGGTNTVTVTNFVNLALRAGIDKITFVRVQPDSIAGVWLPITNSWEDFYMTNGASRKQSLQRIATQPDILFSATDITPNPVGVPPVLVRTTGNYINNDQINGVSESQLSGPGVIVSPVDISINKVGPWFLLAGGGEQNHIQGVIFGSYDGTTNTPTIYPSGTSIKALEQAIMSGAANSRLNPYLAPAALLQPAAGTAQVANDTGGATP